MADFRSAFARTLKFEGGYANDPDDRGGETYRGIARKVWPSWEGWVTVDNLKYANLLLDDNRQLQVQVEGFYRKNFWNPIKGDSLPDPVARELFDCAVNCGIGTAVRFLQRAIGVADDGAFGADTFRAVTTHLLSDGAGVLVEKLKSQRRERYARIAENDPSQAKFLKGWMRRADEGVA